MEIGLGGGVAVLKIKSVCVTNLLGTCGGCFEAPTPRECALVCGWLGGGGGKGYRTIVRSVVGCQALHEAKLGNYSR